jgi:putative membrane protein
MPDVAAMQPLFADARGFGHMDGFGWSMMAIAWLVMLAIIGLIVWVVVQAASGSSRSDSDPTESAQRILADRFARGEIDDEEYRRRSTELGR